MLRWADLFLLPGSCKQHFCECNRQMTSVFSALQHLDASLFFVTLIFKSFPTGPLTAHLSSFGLIEVFLLAQPQNLIRVGHFFPQWYCNCLAVEQQAVAKLNAQHENAMKIVMAQTSHCKSTAIYKDPQIPPTLLIQRIMWFSSRCLYLMCSHQEQEFFHWVWLTDVWLTPVGKSHRGWHSSQDQSHQTPTTNLSQCQGAPQVLQSPSGYLKMLKFSLIPLQSLTSKKVGCCQAVCGSELC